MLTEAGPEKAATGFETAARSASARVPVASPDMYFGIAPTLLS